MGFKNASLGSCSLSSFYLGEQEQKEVGEGEHAVLQCRLQFCMQRGWPEMSGSSGFLLKSKEEQKCPPRSRYITAV